MSKKKSRTYQCKDEYEYIRQYNLRLKFNSKNETDHPVQYTMYRVCNGGREGCSKGGEE